MRSVSAGECFYPNPENQPNPSRNRGMRNLDSKTHAAAMVAEKLQFRSSCLNRPLSETERTARNIYTGIESSDHTPKEKLRVRIGI